LITVEPAEDAGEKERFRYPAIVCELLCSEVEEMDNQVVNNAEYFDKLFDFFNKDKVNPFLATFVCRVASCYLLVKPKETITYMKNKAGFIDNFFRHLDVGAVTEFLTKLINLESQPEGAGTLDWLSEQEFIRKIIRKFDVQFVHMHSDVAQTLLDIISVSSPNSPLLTQLASEDTMRLLFDLMLSPTSGSSSAIHYGLSVLIGLIIPIGSLLDESDTEGDSDDEGEKQKAEVTMENLPAWIRLLLDKLADLKNVLLNPTNAPQFNLPSGNLKKAFGMDRIKILEYIDALLGFQSKPVDKVILDHDLVSVIMDLFFEYEWNTFIQNIAQSIIEHILDDDHDEMRESLFSKTKIIDRIVNGERANKEIEAKPQGVRRAYMGHLLNIAEKLKEAAEHDDVVRQHLSSHPSWNEFVSGPLTVKEAREAITLGGAQPRSSDRYLPDQDIAQLGRSLSGGGFQGLLDLSNYANYNQDDEDDDDQDGDDDDDDDDDDGQDDEHDLIEEEGDDDVDMDSDTDGEDYDTEQSEVLLTKQEIEAIEI
jgi:hypothetical protein